MKRAVLADVRNGQIVRVDGQWGVRVAGGGKRDSRSWCLVDFWWEGKQWVRAWKVVQVDA